MFGRKKKGVQESDYFLSTTKVTGDIVINGVTVFKDDGLSHRLSVQDGKICIDGKDVTAETIKELDKSEDKVDADYDDSEGNVYFENLVLQVGSCEKVETDAPDLNVQSDTHSGIMDYMELDVICDGDLTVKGNIRGYLDVDGEARINGHYKALPHSTFNSDDPEIDGDFYADYLDGGTVYSHGDVTIKNTANGRILSDGDVTISS